MDQIERPEAQSMGKVLAFRRARQSSAAARAPFKPGDGFPNDRRRGSFDRCCGQAWMVLAWCLALGRLQVAVGRHEAFGVEDVLAFLVTVLMPIMRGHKIVEAFSTGVYFARELLGRSRASRHSAATVSKSA